MNVRPLREHHHVQFTVDETCRLEPRLAIIPAGVLVDDRGDPLETLDHLEAQAASQKRGPALRRVERHHPPVLASSGHNGSRAFRTYRATGVHWSDCPTARSFLFSDGP